MLYGVTVGAVALVGGLAVSSLSGAAFNPASRVRDDRRRRVAWPGLWVYLVAQLGGAFAAAAFATRRSPPIPTALLSSARLSRPRRSRAPSRATSRAASHERRRPRPRRSSRAVPGDRARPARACTCGPQDGLRRRPAAEAGVELVDAHLAGPLGRGSHSSVQHRGAAPRRRLPSTRSWAASPRDGQVLVACVYDPLRGYAGSAGRLAARRASRSRARYAGLPALSHPPRAATEPVCVAEVAVGGGGRTLPAGRSRSVCRAKCLVLDRRVENESRRSDASARLCGGMATPPGWALAAGTGGRRAVAVALNHGVGLRRLHGGGGAGDDGGEVDAAGEGAERAAVLRAEAGGAERVRHRGGCVLHQQGALEAGGHPPGEPAGADLERGGVGQRLQHACRWPGRGAGPRRGPSRPRRSRRSAPRARGTAPAARRGR